MAVNLDLAAFKRVPFVEEIVVLGPDYTGAIFAMHLKNRPGDTGTPLVILNAATAGTEGISVVYNAAYVFNDAGDTAPASIITVQIDQATLEALPLNQPTEKPLVLAYDMHVQPTGDFRQVVCYGTFTIYPGVTG